MAELVRDRLVCGIRDDVIQRSLLSVAKLTFDKACELALLHESAEENSKVLSAPTAVHRTERQAPATAVAFLKIIFQGLGILIVLNIIVGIFKHVKNSIKKLWSYKC